MKKRGVPIPSRVAARSTSAEAMASSAGRPQIFPLPTSSTWDMNSPSMHVAGGSLRDVDARIVGLRGPGGFDQHVDATASLDRARIAIGGLRKPLRNVHGEIALYRNGLLLQSVGATIADVPIRARRGDLRPFRSALSAYRCRTRRSPSIARRHRSIVVPAREWKCVSQRPRHRSRLQAVDSVRLAIAAGSLRRIHAGGAPRVRCLRRPRGRRHRPPRGI